MRARIHNGYLALYSERLTRMFGGSPHVRAVAPFPFCIIFRDEEQEKMEWVVRHEKIHFRQELELLWIGAILLELIEKMYGRFFLGKSKLEAYKWCSMEQEAYRNQNDPDYLKNRPTFRLFYYMKNKKSFALYPDKPGEVHMLE